MTDQLHRTCRHLTFRPKLLLALLAFCGAAITGALALDDAYIPWGDSQHLGTNDYIVDSNFPSWFGSAFKTGSGVWDTNIPAWYVSPDASNDAALGVLFSRSLLSNSASLIMKLGYLDSSNSSLSLNMLLMTNQSVAVTNLFSNILTGRGLGTSLIFNVSLADTNAIGLQFRRGVGSITIYDTLLSPDGDGDGFSDTEEAIWGSDPGSALSIPCAAITGQVFYAGVQSGVIHVLAATNANDWASAYYLTMSLPTASHIAPFTLPGLPLRRPYYARAWRDVNANQLKDYWEPSGVAVPASLLLSGNTGSVVIVMSDPDTDGDGLSDADELLNGFDPLAWNPYAHLPFIEGFEANTAHLGDVNGQNLWQVSIPGAAIIQTNRVYEGTQALMFTTTNDPVDVRHWFGVSNEPVVWVDMQVQALPCRAPTNTVVGSAIVFFDNKGQLTAYDGARSSSNKWVAFTNAPACEATGEWVRISLRLNYPAQRWLICQNGFLAAGELGFASPVSQFTMFSLSGLRGGLDALSIGTNEPPGLSLDGDRLPDDWERARFGNLDQVDSGDLDQDGASNLEEYLYGTDVNSPDTDGDGLPDGWEIHNGFDPKHAGEAALDPDGDGLTNLQEYQLGTNPKSPDTDGDGMPDKWEVDHQLNPLVNDATQDTDADGLSNLLEFQKGAEPHNLDSDGDGLWDGAEVNTYGTSPVSTDSDGDGFPDVWEVLNGTRPNVADADADTDGDGLSNMEEFLRGTPPASATNALKRLMWSGVSTGSWTDASWLNAPPAYPGATEDACLVSNVMLSIDGSQKVNILQVTKGEVRVGGTLAPYSVVLSNGVLSSAGAGSFDSPNPSSPVGPILKEYLPVSSACLTPEP